MRVQNGLVRTAAIAATSVALALGITWCADRAPAVPHVAWRVDGAAIEPWAEVAPFVTVRCTLELPRPAWVYAASWNPSTGCLALHPSETLRSDLPAHGFPAGRYELPGTHLGRELSWDVGDAGGPTTFAIVVSERRSTPLEDDMASLRQVGNAAFPHRAILGTYAPKLGIDAVPARSEPPPDVLGEAWAGPQPNHDGAMHELREGLWVSALRVRVPLERAMAEAAPAARIADRLERELGPVLAPGGPPR